MKSLQDVSCKMKGKSILIVDDDQVILKSLEGVLNMEGYRVDTAGTGQEAIKKFQANFYNLALLDIKLPDMDGTELLSKIHQTEPKMMKIMVTGYPELNNAVQSLNLGADAYLMKPVNPKMLLKVVKEKLGEQEEVEKMSEEKVRNWIENRVMKLKTGEA
jgi:DNA-binding NtrC family response regulator